VSVQPIVVGVTGGSGSGKTTLARALGTAFPGGAAQVLMLDYYYRDRAGIPLEERTRINFDHPEAFDEPLLVEQVRALKAGRPVERPVYDFVRHTRAEETVAVRPSPVVVLEGILVLAMEALRPFLDLKVFVDTPSDVRLARRVRRDVAERGRTVESVVDQYLATVRPMHAEFIEPTRNHADLIVPGEGDHERTLRIIRTEVERLLAAER